MKKYLLITAAILIAILAYTLMPSLTKSVKTKVVDTETKMLPRVLFLTTGLPEGKGELSEGVEVAIQSFNKRGAFVMLDNRNVLLQPEVLEGYTIMIIPTSQGYHDGDRKYSLTFLSDLEMQNISDWVKKGGTLITEENIGRNTQEGVDRADVNGELNPKSWKLSEVFGIKMKEKDLNGFSIEEKDAKIWNGRIKERVTDDEWVLIPSEIISDKTKILAEWISADEKIPAIIQNDFGKGKAVLFTSTYILHPSNDGGVSSIEQIEKFYEYAFNNFSETSTNNFELNPWPNGYSTAFCVSFNSDGEPDKYRLTENFLKKENLSATFFVDSSFNNEEKTIFEGNKNITLQSNLYSRQDFSESDYSYLASEVLMNEEHFNMKFSGIRFPYYSTNFWGLIFTNDRGYIYDSSIGVDQLTTYTGSVFPYNIPVSNDSYYKTLNLLEICPVKKDDIFFYGKAETGNDYTEDLQRNDALLFEKYLLDFYDFVVLKNDGLMVYIGNPGYSGFSEITMQPLKKLTDTLKTKNCWMTTLEEVAEYRNKIKDLIITGNTDSGNDIKLKISLPEQTIIKNLSFKFKSKPGKISTQSENDLKEAKGFYYLITDVKNGDEISFTINTN